MRIIFSTELTKRLIQYFQTKHGVFLSTEQASEYLRAYTELFLAFAEIESGREAAGAFSAADSRALGSTDSCNTRGTLQDAP